MNINNHRPDLSLAIFMTLLAYGGVAHAQATTTLPPVIAVGVPYSGGGYTVGGSGGWCGACAPTDFNSGTLYFNNSEFVEPPNNVLTCPYLEDNWPPGCPLPGQGSAPVAAAPNGCGSESTDWAVPDFYAGNPGSGNIFTGPCDTHDGCYSMFGGPSRSTCDFNLRNDMRGECETTYPYFDLPAGATRDAMEDDYEGCFAQSNTYYSALQSSTGVWHLAATFYDSARRDADCRNAHALYVELGCSF